MKFCRTLIILLSLSLFLYSCASKKKVVYLQNIESAALGADSKFEPVLQPDDLLSIIVSSETPELTVPFNIPAIQGNYQVDNNQNGIKTYLIDNAGYIDFPVIGKIKLAGMSRTEAIVKMSELISQYITNPSINLRILNYKISVLGEVNKPSTFTLASERLTLLEALSMAGDLTIYGKRTNILVVRESEGKKTFSRVDITKADFLTSPYYYLAQNDVVVVEPNQTRVNSSVVGPNVTVLLSIASFLVTIGVIIFNNN